MVNDSNSILRHLARVGLLGALALHLCAAALGPWAHAAALVQGDPGVEAFHPGEPHVERAEVGHHACALCLTVGQPTLGSSPPSAFQPLTVRLASLRGDGRIPPPRWDLPVRARGPPPPGLDRTERA